MITIGRHQLHHGDALDVLRSMPDASVDAVVTDPPYPEAIRKYGTLTVDQWETLMHGVVRECRRVLVPSGSAVFILQPNSEKIGKLRPWLFDFISWCCREWNVVQDAWWWNDTSPPTTHCQERYGLMRPSVKACVWAGASDCYRNQDKVLSPPSATMAKIASRDNRDVRTTLPSGLTRNVKRFADSVNRRGGVTPFNLLKANNANSRSSSGAHGHGAGTPFEVCDWWVRYLTPPGGRVLDPFNGCGTTGLAADKRGMTYVGIEQERDYINATIDRLKAAQQSAPLFAA